MRWVLVSSLLCWRGDASSLRQGYSGVAGREGHLSRPCRKLFYNCACTMHHIRTRQCLRMTAALASTSRGGQQRMQYTAAASTQFQAFIFVLSFIYNATCTPQRIRQRLHDRCANVVSMQPATARHPIEGVSRSILIDHLRAIGASSRSALDRLIRSRKDDRVVLKVACWNHICKERKCQTYYTSHTSRPGHDRSPQ